MHEIAVGFLTVLTLMVLLFGVILVAVHFLGGS